MVVMVWLMIMSLLVPSVTAFTNGTLLPSYLCGPATDGFPKTLGGVLPFFKLATNPFLTAVNGVPPNGNLDMQFGGRVNHTQLLLSNFHNKNSIIPFKFVIHTTVVAVTSLTNPTPIAPAGQIIPGAVHQLQLQSTPNDLKVFDDNTALDGTFLYAMDVNMSQRVGSFVAFGPNMQGWAPCGPNNVGAIHNQLLSCTGHYDGLMWQAPANLAIGDVIDFRGAAVTDNGFGAHTSMYRVVAQPAAAGTSSAGGGAANLPAPLSPILTKVLVMGQTQALTFFVSNIGPTATAAATTFQTTTQMFATIDAAVLAAANLFAATPVAVSATALASQIVTCAASPCTTNLATLFQKAGTTNGFLLTNVVAMASATLVSTSSNPSIFPVGTAAAATAAAAPIRLIETNNFASAVYPTPASATDTQTNPLLAMCENMNAYGMFNMTLSADSDNSCAWYTNYAASLIATAVNPQDTGTNNNNQMTIIIIAAAVGGAVLLAVIAAAGWWLSKKQSTKASSQQNIVGRMTSM